MLARIKKRPDLFLLLTCVFFIMAVLQWSFPTTDIPDAWLDIQESGIIRIGFSYESPYAFLDEQGNPTGEAVETARLVVKALGLKKIEWRLSNFGTLLERLQQGEFDVIAASMSITEERLRMAAFSDPSLQVSLGLLVQSGNPFKIASYKDLLRNKQIRVVVIAGSIEETLLRKSDISDTRIATVQTVEAGANLLIHNQVDAFLLTAPVAKSLKQQFASNRLEFPGSFAIREGDFASPIVCGFAFRKDNSELLVAWNKAQALVIGSSDHRAILDRFEIGAEGLPFNSTR